MSRLFRENSLKRAQSPEQLGDITEVNKPYVWLVIISALVLMCGFFVWAIFGYIPTKITANALVTSNVGTIYLNVDSSEGIKEGTKIKVGGNEFTVKAISEKPISAEQVKALVSDDYLYEKINPSPWCVIITFDTLDISDGIHSISITVNETKAVSFIFN